MRPRIPKGLDAAYSVFELLLPELLLRGSKQSIADAATICRELGRPDNAACFTRWVLLGEFERVVTTVLYFGAHAVEAQIVWPPRVPSVDAPVRELVKRVRAGVELVRLCGTQDERAVFGGIAAAASEGRVVDPTRLRPPRRPGRPRSPEVDGLCELVLREALFPKGRSLRSALAAASKLAPRWNALSIRRRHERLRKTEVPIPPDWRQTLIAERIDPLYGDPLKPTTARLAIAVKLGDGVRASRKQGTTSR